MATSGRDLTDHEREQIRRAREQGMSVRDTARRYSVSPTTVQKISATGIAK